MHMHLLFIIEKGTASDDYMYSFLPRENKLWNELVSVTHRKDTSFLRMHRYCEQKDI